MRRTTSFPGVLLWAFIPIMFPLLGQEKEEVEKALLEANDKMDQLGHLKVFDMLSTRQILSFPGDVGLINNDNYEISAAMGFLTLQRHYPENFTPEKKHGLSTNVLPWLDALLTDPNNETNVLGLLRSPKPAMRMIGMDKAAYADVFSDPLRSALFDILNSDPYVKLGSVKLPPSDLPDLQYDSHYGFVARLRRFAKTILKFRGVDAEIDNASVTKAGVVAYVDHYYQYKDHQAKIARSLSKMEDPRSPGWIELSRLFHDKSTDARIMEMLHAADKEYSRLAKRSLYVPRLPQK